ncbi:MAG: hypothetical protein ACTHW2_01300 [Tissierella sp.]|uniref:hypothetical protein n=1 Tax=Tissierella sp. TaxID=41274 RepID=UPI003F9B02B7
MYINPYYKKIKGSYILLISCGYCKTDIAKYQKVGKGNVLRLSIDRIIELSTKLSKKLTCPSCGKILGTRVFLKKENRKFYKMFRSTFNTKNINY